MSEETRTQVYLVLVAYSVICLFCQICSSVISLKRYYQKEEKSLLGFIGFIIGFVAILFLLGIGAFFGFFFPMIIVPPTKIIPIAIIDKVAVSTMFIGVFAPVAFVGLILFYLNPLFLIKLLRNKESTGILE